MKRVLVESRSNVVVSAQLIAYCIDELDTDPTPAAHALAEHLRGVLIAQNSEVAALLNAVDVLAASIGVMEGRTYNALQALINAKKVVEKLQIK